MVAISEEEDLQRREELNEEVKYRKEMLEKLRKQLEEKRKIRIIENISFGLGCSFLSGTVFALSISESIPLVKIVTLLMILAFSILLILYPLFGPYKNE